MTTQEDFLLSATISLNA